MEKIKFNRTVFFEGRNGFFKCAGIELTYNRNKAIELYPITSRGWTGRLRLDIPAEHVEEFCSSLMYLKDRKEGRLTVTGNVNYIHRLQALEAEMISEAMDHLKHIGGIRETNLFELEPLVSNEIEAFNAEGCVVGGMHHGRSLSKLIEDNIINTADLVLILNDIRAWRWANRTSDNEKI